MGRLQLGSERYFLGGIELMLTIIFCITSSDVVRSIKSVLSLVILLVQAV